MHKKRGFTLIEMLVALLMLSVAVAFSTIIIHTIGITRDSAYENIAFRIADSKLDELRDGGYVNLPASGAFTSPGLANLPYGSASTSVTSWNIQTKQVTAGVSWLGTGSVTRFVSLTTLITEIGGL